MLFNVRIEAVEYMEEFGLKGLYIRENVLHKHDADGPYFQFEYYFSSHSPVCNCGNCPVWEPGESGEEGGLTRW